MTKDQYIQWKATRGDDAGLWDREQCKAADSLIKLETLGALKNWLAKNITNVTIRDYVWLMTRCHFGSYETDQFLQKLGMYPDWM
jgi:hypothetical protein